MAQLVAIRDIKLDASGFRRVMKQFAMALGKMGGAVVKQQAAMLADELLNYTLPVESTGGGRSGVSKGALAVGKKSLKHDVSSIFRPLHEARYEEIAAQEEYSVFVAWVADRQRHNKKMGLRKENLNPEGWAAFQSAHAGGSRRSVDFSGVNRGETFIRQTHVTVRGGTNVQNYKWEVSNNNKKYFIENYEYQLPAYIRKAEKNIGRLKSGWAEACRALGRNPDSAPWIDQNQHGSGYAVDESSNTNLPTVTIANRIHFLMGQGAGTTLWQSAFHHRNYSMRVAIAERINKIASGDPKRANEMIAALELSSKEYTFQIESK